MTIEEDEVFEDYFPEKKKKKKRKRGRSTDVFITLNLNEVFKDMPRERKVLFRDFCEQLFGPRKGILLYFKDRENPSDPLVNMDSTIVNYQPEVGKLKDRLHVHALVAIEHHGFYSFQANRLRAECERVFGHSIYLSAPISSNERVKWQNYLLKGS